MPFSYPTPVNYAGSQAQTSQGTTLWVNYNPATGAGTSPPNWLQIGEPTNATFSDKNEFDESTNLSSQAKEFVAVLPDPGGLDVELNRVSENAGQNAVQASYHANPPSLLTYLVVFPQEPTQASFPDAREFKAYVESISPDIKVNKIIKSKFKLKISGPITEIEGS